MREISIIIFPTKLDFLVMMPCHLLLPICKSSIIKSQVKLLLISLFSSSFNYCSADKLEKKKIDRISEWLLISDGRSVQNCDKIDVLLTEEKN